MICVCWWRSSRTSRPRAGLVVVPLCRMGRKRSLLQLIPTRFVLGWVLVGGGDARREVAAVPRRIGSTACPRPRGGPGCRRAARVRFPRAVVVVAGLDRFHAAPASGARSADGAGGRN